MTISEERFTDLQEPPSAIAAFIREPSDFVETIHVYGDVDLSNSVELERAINAPRPADHSIVVDLANCQYVDSTALATLVLESDVAPEVSLSAN